MFAVLFFYFLYSIPVYICGFENTAERRKGEEMIKGR
jgi:hypothetical protein